ncbi:hypothetical protein ACFOY4_24345 [Actinomadura syzygii]|uniref:Uncharacterized protein n=1 Tax=Actinomadura syzygii TaxID=1427538 RepID=A0A5D0ULD9_9ACTN|nr:hypothetical protein [Actinomadura syzygii]TYC18442.1 hypothetical protein FXF65_01380 [Actinomadura syzygii]
MGFSIAQYQAATDKINVGMTTITNKMGEIPGAVEKAQSHWYVPGWLKDSLAWIGEKLWDLCVWFKDRVLDLLKGVLAPIMFFKYAWDWTGVRGGATGVQGATDPAVLDISRRWEGDANADYLKVIPLQGKAAGRVGSISMQMSLALTTCATAGLAFYVALAIIVYQFISCETAAIAALCSGILSWAGVVGAFTDAGVTAAMIWGAVGTLTAALGAQGAWMVSLKGEASDSSTFPKGHWPDATYD